ncbi:SDR family NAD(P)-dependent oxidoreductase [Mycolicibacterium boenickei]
MPPSSTGKGRKRTASLVKKRDSMDLQLDGRVAIVTGGSKGIGRAIASTLLAEGARVVIASRSAPDFGGQKGDYHHVEVDLMNGPDASRWAVDAAIEHFGRLDILVNNAGGRPPGVTLPQFGFMAAGDIDWQRMFEFNLFSAVRACRAAIPSMLDSGGGAIVNVSSGHARQPSAMNVDYTAAKAGLESLTVALSEEYAPQGIRVNTVSCGPVRTSWWTEPGGAADVLAEQVGADRDEVLDRVAPEMMNLSTGRLVDPREIADVVALLVSPRSASTTGAAFVVDAGYLKSV